MADILVVDDEPILRQLFERVLAHEGHRVRLAANGRDALASLGEGVPDLILLDLQMPTMDGTTFLRHLRRVPEWSKLPVIVMSAVADESRVRDAGTLGVRDYLLKAGFSLKTLRQRLDKYLEPRSDPKPEPAATAAMLVE